MDINDQMLSKFKCFLNDICKVFPEHSDSIQQNYNVILELDSLVIDENEIISEFLENISNISDNIINKDNEIFTDDLFLIKDISMKTLWSSDISKKTKDSIWGYLNVFSLINLNITSGKMMENTQNKLESGEKITKKELKVMKDLKKLNENINAKNSDNASLSDDTFDSLENTSLGNLAKEITKDLNIDDTNAQDMLNPNNMMNIFQTINSTLQQKVDNNELDMNSLFSEASGFMNNSGLMNNMMGMMGAGTGSDGGGEGMPDIGNMMNMMSQMMQQPPPQQANQRQPSQQSQNINPTQQRLRKKLEERQNNN